jgi:glycosyltransferase A (GT-A) superfamily protein (DUF2064 family)
MRRCLIIVAKEPIAGLVKTRLAASIGAERTAALYRCFLHDTITLARRVHACDLALSFWPPDAAPHFRTLDPAALLFPQSGADFGHRLLSAFEQAAAAGYDELVLIGSDNPSLPPDYVAQAFAALAAAPAVLGPSEDGGYGLSYGARAALVRHRHAGRSPAALPRAVLRPWWRRAADAGPARRPRARWAPRPA